MKKLIILCAASLIIAAAAEILPTASDRQIYEKTVRLHVLAASDSEGDQSNKLAVRDSVLELLAPALDGARSRDEAAAVICENEENIICAAKQTLALLGSKDDVSIDFSEEYYPRKSYGDVTLPAGTYLSLRVNIGVAEGKNWWCVLFPTLCTSSAQPRETLARAGFTPGQVKLITESRSTKYKLKFRLLELFEEWFD